MNWPVPQDFNEAVQTPGLAFSDVDLKSGQVIVGAHGMPLPRSGNFADVYQVRGADGRNWAIKCFTRPVAGLDERYRKISEQLGRLKLPITVDFQFLPQGVRVRGEWYPAVKMEWVEGLLLNQFVRENVGKPHVLDALFQMWVRLCRRLREAGIAHADLQHGNVLLVPGSKSGSLGLKLIDYDGMYLPALANQPSGELGHANYQHPDRAAKHVFSPDLDRFPHLVIATALKALACQGASLWDRYDTGENLLFSESDFLAPARSRLVQELLRSNDPGVISLLGRLAVACRKPIPQTPWLDLLAPEGVVASPTAAESREAMAAFDLGAISEPPPPPPPSFPPGTRAAFGTRMAPAGIAVGDWGTAAERDVDVEPIRIAHHTPAAIAVPQVERNPVSGFPVFQPREARPERKLKYAIVAMLLLLVLVTGGIIVRYTQVRTPVKNQEVSRRSEPGHLQAPRETTAEAEQTASNPAEKPVTNPPPQGLAIAPPPREVLELAVAPAPREVNTIAVRPPDPMPPMPPVNRLPVPDEAALAKSLDQVREAFKTEYARKLPSDRKLLAGTLFKLAEATGDDPVGRYAALQEARNFAIEGQDPVLALQAVEALAKTYEVDAIALRLQTLEKMAALLYTPAGSRGIVDMALLASDATADLEDYDAALKMAQIASTVAKKVSYASVLEDADLRVTQLRRLKDAFTTVKASLSLLQTVPNHPEANLTIGKFRCFTLGRWQAGLPFLARGSDAAIKQAALAELEPPGETPNSLKIADLWWAAAQSAPEAERLALESRARIWYRTALPGLTGLTQKTAESRLGFTLGGIEYEPGLVVEFFPPQSPVFHGKKGRIDSTIDFSGQEFAETKGKNRPSPITLHWKGYFVPPIPGRYTLEIKSVDNVRVRANNKILLDTAVKGPKKSAVVAYLGRPLPIVLEYQGVNTGAHGVQLFWKKTSSAPEELVPAEVLFHDRKTAAFLTK